MPSTQTPTVHLVYPDGQVEVFRKLTGLIQAEVDFHT